MKKKFLFFRRSVKRLGKAGFDVSTDDGGKIYLLGLEILRIRKKVNEIVDLLNKTKI